MDPTEPEVSQWMIWVGGVLGTAFAAFVTALGLRAKGPPGETHAEVVGALIDTKAATVLAGSIEGLGLQLIESRLAAAKVAADAAEAATEAAEAAKENTRVLQMHRETLQDHKRDLELLRQDVRDLTLQMAHRR